MADNNETWKSHWKCFVACGVIVLSPFQYGVDFGLIGGLQAMPGFLKVRLQLQWTAGLMAIEANICTLSRRSLVTPRLTPLSAGISIPSDNSSFPPS